MKDTRNPEDVYYRIIEEKTTWNVGILEAADRVESDAADAPPEPSPLAPPARSGPGSYRPLVPPQNGSSGVSPPAPCN